VDRTRIAVQDFGDVSEINRHLAPFKLVGTGKIFDESAQAEAIEVRCKARPRRGLLDHIHP